MQLIVISSPAWWKGESKWINPLFESGMERLHLRKPGMDVHSYRLLIEGIEPAYRSRLVLHQHHHLAEALGICRLHFSEAEREAKDHLKIQLPGEVILSSSIHTLPPPEGLERFEYVFYGPMFDSISKPDYPGKFRDRADWDMMPGKNKLVPLGGINEQNLPELRASGFKAAGVLGAIWEDPEQSLVQFLKLLALCNA